MTSSQKEIFPENAFRQGSTRMQLRTVYVGEYRAGHVSPT